MDFHYDQLDIRELDGGRLLASQHLSDNVMAVLAKLEDRIGGIREVLHRIGRLRSRAQRDDAISRLLSTAELRNLEHTVNEEIDKMPVTLKTSVRNKVFGPWIRQGMQKGEEKGLARGIERGLAKGTTIERQRMLSRFLERRFGVLPQATKKRIGELTERQADNALAGAADGRTLQQLFPRRSSKR